MPLLSRIFNFILVLVTFPQRIFHCILTLLGFPWRKIRNADFGYLSPYWRFFYASFLKPHAAVSANGQRDALESFYSSQADAYDVTRARLLKGREDMLALAAAQLKFRKSGGNLPKHRIWVDVRMLHSRVPCG